LSDKLSTEISSFFSKEQISSLAHQSEFVKRRSKLKAWMFLETIIFSKFNQKKLSLNEIANNLQCNYGLEISKQGVDERFTLQSVEFLKNCTSALLRNHFQQQTSIPVFTNFKRIRIKDSTSFQVPESMKDQFPGTGGSASEASIKIQYEFDLKNGNVLDFELTAGNVNDFADASKKKEDIEKGDLCLRDLGYISVDSIAHCNNNEAYHISRLKAQTGIYSSDQKNRKSITLQDIQNKLQSSGNDLIEMDVFVGDRKYIPVRMIACLLPEEKMKERIKKMRRRQVTAGREFKEEFCQTAGLNVFITNIPEEMMSAMDVYNTYKLRWQIELVFKIWKSIGEIQLVKDVKQERLLTLLYAKLVWLLLNWHIINEISNQLFQLSKERLSGFKSSITLLNCIDKIRDAIRNKNKLILLINRIIKTLIKNNKCEKRQNRINSIELLI
jgi:hypothetical protein